MPLKDTLDLSDKLVEKETHAFKLVSEAANVTDVPQKVKDYMLTEEEEKLTAEEKINEARTLLRGKIYSDIKKITLVLEDYTNSISENKSVEPKGTVELKYLGKAVNNYIQMQNVKQNELRYKAEIDPLTQVANRRTLEEFMDKKLQQKGSRGAFLFFDVDEFKSINDSYGHDVGDEFVVWIEDTSKENTDFIKERIDDINKNNINFADMVIELTVSAGVTFRKEGDNYKDVLRRADEALYHKKRGGKNGCSIYEELEHA